MTLISKIISNYKNNGMEIDKVCISKFDNNKKYAEVQNSDSGLATTMHKMDNDKGFFKDGKAHCFMENKILYVVNKYRINKYKVDEEHTNDVLLFVGSRRDRTKDQYLVQYNLTSEVPVLGLQTGYQIVNACSKAQQTYGKKINFYTENYDSSESETSEVDLEIDEAYLIGGRNDLQNKTSKASDKRLNHPYTKEHHENKIKKNLITAIFNFEDTISTMHNYNTQYHTVFTDDIEEKYNGTFVALSRQILFTYLTSGDFACSAKVFTRNISVEVTKPKEGNSQ